MPATAADFAEFIHNIQLTAAQREACRNAQQDMRERLMADADIKEVVISMFLQGSVRRATCVKPINGEESDVDLVVATILHERDHRPAQAWQRFAPFLRQHFGSGQNQRWRAQGRSVCVSYPAAGLLPAVDLDLVVTSEPTSAVMGLLKSDPFIGDPDYDPLEKGEVLEEVRKAAARSDTWKTEPLRIPDRDAQAWEDTDPLTQIKWTRAKNAGTNGHFTHTVMAMKWWQRVTPGVERPKGFTLEAIVGACCPDEVTGLEQAIVATLDEISRRFAGDVAAARVPVLQDVGTRSNVLKRVSASEFAAFHHAAVEAAGLARKAAAAESRADACRIWQLIFGPEFPTSGGRGLGGGNGSGSGGFVAPSRPANPRGERFA